MTIRNIGNYLKKKYNCITVYAYPESIDGTCEVMFYYTLLTKDYKVLITEVNRRDVNKRLYGKEYIDWNNDKERIEAEKFEANNKYAMYNLIEYMGVEKVNSKMEKKDFLENILTNRDRVKNLTAENVKIITKMLKELQ